MSYNVGKDDSTREQNLAKIDELMEKAKLNGLASKINSGNNTQELSIHFEAANGKIYDGVVVVKRPNMRDIIRIGVIKADIIQKEAEKAGIRGKLDIALVDATVKIIATWIAELSVVVVKSSPWFANIMDIEDLDLVEHVYSQYTDWLDSFRDGSRNKLKGDSTTAQAEEDVLDTPAIQLEPSQS